MGLVLDIVPNHMGIDGAENHWWWDVLTHGQASPFARLFDIDWEPPIRGCAVESSCRCSGSGMRARSKRRSYASNPGKACPLSVTWNGSFRSRRNPWRPWQLSRMASRPPSSDRVLEQQHYRLTLWRHADTDLNYRRFFNIASLAALRVEDETVFRAVQLQRVGFVTRARL